MADNVNDSLEILIVNLVLGLIRVRYVSSINARREHDIMRSWQTCHDYRFVVSLNEFIEL